MTNVNFENSLSNEIEKINNEINQLYEKRARLLLTLDELNDYKVQYKYFKQVN